MKKTFFAAACLMMISVITGLTQPERVAAAEAGKVNVSYEHSGGKKCDKLSDGSVKDGPTSSSYVAFAAGESLKVGSKVPLQGLYIKWSAVCLPGEWELITEDGVKICGKYGFVHEYVELPEGTTSCTLHFPNKAGIIEIEAYEEGDLPRDVQRWEPACEKADLLVLSTHADDEVLFLGAPCVLYAGQEGLKVQVVYLCDFTLNDYGYRNVTREHEKLDGLWTMGITNYPLNGNFPDVYCGNLETAMQKYKYETIVEFVTENIRRFKPLILVSQDFNGEYGHGAHRIFAKAAAEALEICKDASVFEESAIKYGTWNVPKAYYHLYWENKIRLDVRTPLSAFEGATSLDVQKVAFKKHVTQQGTRFVVSDEKPQYDCAAFGLYRSLVGNDTGNDMTENITTYEEMYETAVDMAILRGRKQFFRYSNTAGIGMLH